jgi:hypothetical protein
VVNADWPRHSVKASGLAAGRHQEQAEMAITPLNSFADVQQFLTQVVADNNEVLQLQNAPHKAFWNTLTFDQFVNGNIPHVRNPDTGDPIPILVKGKSDQSNIIMALSGTGPIFGPDGPVGQMPPRGTKFTADQIASIANWIDAGCPELNPTT